MSGVCCSLHLCMEFHHMCMHVLRVCIACLPPLDVPLLTFPSLTYMAYYFPLGMEICGICNGRQGVDRPWGVLKMFPEGDHSGWMHHVPTCEVCTHGCEGLHIFRDAHYSDHPIGAFFGGCTEPSKTSKKWVPRAPTEKPY